MHGNKSRCQKPRTNGNSAMHVGRERDGVRVRGSCRGRGGVHCMVRGGDGEMDWIGRIGM